MTSPAVISSIPRIKSAGLSLPFAIPVRRVSHSAVSCGDVDVYKRQEWKGGIDLTTFGRNAAAQEKGAFTEDGYIVESGDE